MRNLPLPSRDSDRTDLRRAVRRYRYAGELRGHDITDAEIEQIVALYDRYEADSGAAHDDLKGEGLPQNLRDTIHAAFAKTQEGRTLHPIRERLFRDVEQCPICGIAAPDELDHHLPQSVFKPLAIHIRNLVPMCHTCNSAKRAGFGEDEFTGFLHPYYDVLPEVDFLQAAVAVRNEALVVSFAINTGVALPAGWTDRMANQFETFELDDRFQKEVNTNVASHAVSLHLTYRQNGQAGVRALLRLQAEFETAAFHRNHWRPVLLRALADLDEFTDGGFAVVLPIPEYMIEDLGGLGGFDHGH